MAAMKPQELPSPIWVSSDKRLRRLVETLSGDAILAVDTESNSLYAYQEQVCLIQFSTTENDYLVDPLAIEDLSPLAPIFADAGIEKIFHAAEYDLITLSRDFQFKFANLFDTMWAARILGWQAVGLSSILEKEFGVKLDKRMQRANWGRRPLPDDMLNYARLDTHYLIVLRERLREELMEKGLWELAQQDFRRMTRINGRNGREQEPQPCWQRISGYQDLDGRQLAVLRELCEFRDNLARVQDKPLFKVIGDDILLRIAQRPPRSLKEMESLPGVSSRIVQRYGGELLKAVQRGTSGGELYPPPPPPRPDNVFLERVDALRGWRKAMARKMGVESDIVLPRDLLYEIARQDRIRHEKLEEILREVPWRLEQFGEEILQTARQAERRV